eukprot:2987167-Pleurochrysis_carterae.AAC.1
MGIAEWADIYDNKTKEYYTMGELCKKYGVKKSARIMQEYTNVKRLHRAQLLQVEHGALGIIYGRDIKGCSFIRNRKSLQSHNRTR